MHLSIKKFKIASTLFPTILLVIGLTLAFYFAFLKAKHTKLDVVLAPAWHFKQDIINSSQTNEVHANLVIARDPFMPSNLKKSAKKVTPNLKLSMVIINKRHKLCKINDKFYKEGDYGPDFIIKNITEEKVLIERQGTLTWLYLTNI